MIKRAVTTIALLGLLLTFGVQSHLANAQTTYTTPQLEGGGGAIQFKKGVILDKLGDDMRLTFPHVVAAWRVCAPTVTPVITSGSDGEGVHRVGSWHFENRAIDLRGNNLKKSQVECIEMNLKERFEKLLPGVRYVVDFEVFPKNPSRNHFHVHAAPWQVEPVQVAKALQRCR